MEEIIMLTPENTLALVIDFQERLMPFIHSHEELARKAAVLIKGCRTLDVPLLTMQQYTKGLGETIPELRESLGDFVPFEKITFSGLKNDAIKDAITQAGQKHILISGIEAHICVQQTVLDLLADRHSVVLLADCVGSRSDNDKQYAIRRMEKAGAIVTTMESALFEMLVRADHPRRKEISNLVK
jgi:nicotinamidase-related amidase